MLGLIIGNINIREIFMCIRYRMAKQTLLDLPRFFLTTILVKISKKFVLRRFLAWGRALNVLVWRTQPTFEVPKYKGRDPLPKKMVATTPSESVAKIAEDDTIPWQKMYLGEGSKGPIYSEIKAIRIYRVFPEENGEVSIKSCWLYIRRSEDGQTRFSVSNAPDSIPVAELCKASLMRWSIEQTRKLLMFYLSFPKKYRK